MLPGVNINTERVICGDDPSGEGIRTRPGMSVDEIRRLLEEYGIPMDQWGTGSAKTFEHLLSELASGESRLADEDGRLLRITRVVDVDVFYTLPDGQVLHLAEDRQEFKDGRIRRRGLGHSLGEKITPDEDALQAAERALREELGVEGAVKPEYLGLEERFIDSPSYPGLMTKYLMDICRVFLSEDQYRVEGYVENQKDKTTWFLWEEPGR